MIKPPKLSGTSTVAEVLDSKILDDLSKDQGLVYLRICRAATSFGRGLHSPVVINNEDLHRTPTTAARALRELKRHGLVRISSRRRGEERQLTVL